MEMTRHPELKRRMSKMGVDFPFFIAPMVGISNLPFRKLIRSYTPAPLKAMVFTEMLSTRRLANSKLNLPTEVRFDPLDEPVIPQLLGNEERFIAPSLQLLEKANPWGIDINMGCPVTHTLRHNWGVRLMGDPAYAAQVVGMARKHTTRFLSVKMRASPGDDLDPSYLDKLTQALEDAGADWISIHARTRAEKHTGPAHWEVVGEVATKRKIPVVLNGNVQCAQDAWQALAQYPVDGIMIGRAAIVRPWILWQIAWNFGLCPLQPPLSPEEEGAEYLRACLKLVDFYKEDFAKDAAALKQLHFYIGHAVRWLSFGHDFWKQCTREKSLETLKNRILAYQEKHTLKLAAKIDYV